MELKFTFGVLMAQAPEVALTARRGITTALKLPLFIFKLLLLADDLTSKLSKVALVIVIVTASALLGTMGLAGLPVRMPSTLRVAETVTLPVPVVTTSLQSREISAPPPRSIAQSVTVKVSEPAEPTLPETVGALFTAALLKPQESLPLTKVVMAPTLRTVSRATPVPTLSGAHWAQLVAKTKKLKMASERT